VTSSLEKLVEEGTIDSFHAELGAVELDLPELDPGQAFSASYQVIPTLAGRLHAPAASLEIAQEGGKAYHLAPAVWTIK
jgi:hypothetical protein